MNKLTGVLCLALTLSAYSSANAAAPKSNWHFISAEDPMTDEPSEFALVNSGSNLFAIRCSPNKPQDGLAITLSPDIGSYMFKGIDIRFFATRYVADVRLDNDPPTRSLFMQEGKSLRLLDNILPGEETGGLQNTPRLLRFLDRFARASRLRLRIEQKDGTYADWEFNLTGVSGAIDYLGKNCSGNSWLAKG